MVIFAFAEQIQLLPDLTLFFHIGLILVMIWFLNRTFFKPINEILETRERNQGGGLTEAEGILNEVAEKDAEFSKGLLEARNEGYELIEKRRAAALGRKSSKIAKVKTEVSEFLATETEELDKQTTEAESEIRKEAEKMAEKISSNILNAA